MRRDGRWLPHVLSRIAVAVGVHDEGLPQKMDDLGVQAPVLGCGALEQEGVQVSGEAKGEARLVWHGVIIAS